MQPSSACVSDARSIPPVAYRCVDFAGAAIAAAPLLPGSYSQGIAHANDAAGAALDAAAAEADRLTANKWVATGCRVAAAQGDAFHTCWLATCDAVGLLLLGNGASDAAGARQAVGRADAAQAVCARYMPTRDFAAVAEMRTSVDAALQALERKLEGGQTKNRQQSTGPPGTEPRGGGGPADGEPRSACWLCGAATSRAKKCALCQEAVYCGKDCQKKHWAAGHRKSCAGKATKDEGPVPAGRLGE